MYNVTVLKLLYMTHLRFGMDAGIVHGQDIRGSEIPGSADAAEHTGTILENASQDQAFFTKYDTTGKIKGGVVATAGTQRANIIKAAVKSVNSSFYYNTVLGELNKNNRFFKNWSGAVSAGNLVSQHKSISSEQAGVATNLSKFLNEYVKNRAPKVIKNYKKTVAEITEAIEDYRKYYLAEVNFIGSNSSGGNVRIDKILSATTAARIVDAKDALEKVLSPEEEGLAQILTHAFLEWKDGEFRGLRGLSNQDLVDSAYPKVPPMSKYGLNLTRPTMSSWMILLAGLQVGHLTNLMYKTTKRLKELLRHP